MTSHRFSQSLR